VSVPQPLTPAETRVLHFGCKCLVLQQSKAIDNDRDMVRKTLRDIQAAGFNVIRIWAFNDGEGQGKLQTRPGRCIPRALQCQTILHMWFASCDQMQQYC
jgi:hypothetical protein